MRLIAKTGCMVLSFSLLGACASGKEAPALTGMVKIDTTEPFSYGPEVPCNDGQSGDAMCADEFIQDLEKANPEPSIPLKISSFHIDVHEVTNAQYRYCIATGGCSIEPEAGNGPSPKAKITYHDAEAFDDHPVAFVSRKAAEQYCAWVGKRLPTEFEWERVAKGPGDRKRLWPVEKLGADLKECVSSRLRLSTPACEREVLSQPAPSRGPDGQYLPPSAQTTDDYVLESGVAIYHLFGNVAEWTSSRFVARPTCFGELPAGCVPTHECSTLTETCACSGLCDAPGQCDDWRNNPPVDVCGYDPQDSPANSQACFYRCVDADRTMKATPICKGPDIGRVYTLDDLPTDATTSEFIIKGGLAQWGETQSCLFLGSARGTTRIRSLDNDKAADPFVGFRCALDGAKTPPKGYELAIFPVF